MIFRFSAIFRRFFIATPLPDAYAAACRAGFVAADTPIAAFAAAAAAITLRVTKRCHAEPMSLFHTPLLYIIAMLLIICCCFTLILPPLPRCRRRRRCRR